MKSFTDEYPQFHTRSTRAGPKMLIRYCRSNVTQAHRLIRSLKFGEMSFATKLDPLTSISLANQKLSISFPGGEKRDFNLTWLRDHCPCPLCIHPTNRQKLHASGFVSLHQDPKSVTISEGRLIVDWSTGSIESIQDAPKGHTSTYSLDFLKNFNPNQSHTLKLILWERDAFDRAQQTVAYKDMMGSDDAFKIVLKQLKDYGLIIIKDVPREINHVETLAEKFGPIRHTFYGKSWNVKNFPFAKNIAYTSLKLDLHMDLMYFEAPPGLQFLHSLENSCKGGESTFLDSFKAVEILKSQSPDDYKTLTETLVTFAYKNDGHHMHYKRPTIHTNGWNEDLSVYYAPPFQGTLDLDADQSASFYSAFKKFENIIHQESLIHKTFLAPGDCAIFANRRVLHGREAFEPTSGSRHFKGTYVDWDDFKDRLRMHNLYYTS